MDVKVHSVILRREIRRALRSVSTRRFMKDRYNFDGLVLLRYYEVLKDHLRNLYLGRIRRRPWLHFRRLLIEMSLLVDDFLNDPEVFESFGHEALFRRGHLTFEHWQTFQSAKLNGDLDSLERSFDQLDEHKFTQTSPHLLTILHPPSNDSQSGSGILDPPSNDAQSSPGILYPHSNDSQSSSGILQPPSNDSQSSSGVWSNQRGLDLDRCRYP